MPARIKHVAIVSSEVSRLGEFYAALFGMTYHNQGGAAHLSDGYIGMNVNGRSPGRQAGFDHFGIEVDDIEEIRAKVRDDYPDIELLQRPSSRSFAGVSMHDPAGNVFDLSPVSKENRKGVYLDLADDRRNPRHISHLFLRTINAPVVARFYQDVFGFRVGAKDAGDPNVYLTDGTVTLVIAPWRISSYAGTGIERPALDHLGFEVESVEAFESDTRRLTEMNPAIAPRPTKAGAEGEARMKLLATCRFGESRLSDPDGVLLDISAARQVAAPTSSPSAP
ncbi:MAG TPA: VOC family protein [Chloroflexota bacterium]|nr:VOC family protein [Chloroflexota bacterium]